METYEDTLLGSGHIANWPGMHAPGSRIIRDKATGEIIEVLPPTPVDDSVTEEATPTETIAQPEGEVIQ